MRRLAVLALVLAGCTTSAHVQTTTAARRPSPTPIAPLETLAPTASRAPFLPTPGPGEATPTPRTTARPSPAATPVPVTSPAAPAVVCPPDTQPDAVCIVKLEHPVIGTDLYLATTAVGTHSFTFSVTGTNIADPQLVALGVVTHDRPVKVATVTAQDQSEAWQYNSTFHEIRGDYRAQPDGTLYRLPWQAGVACPVAQGWNGAFSHQGQDALDFTMPIGTPVRAARGGLVVYTFDQATTNGTDPALKDTYPVNEIQIQHDDGTLGIYLHLDHQAVLVHPGDHVDTGQQIARSGNTGFSTGPHLHFECRGPDQKLHNRTFPVLFQTTPGATAGVQPLEGQTYTAF